MEKENKRSALMLLIGLIVGFTGVICIAGYFLVVGVLNVEEPVTSPEQMVQTQTQTAPTWNTVSNSELGFELKYPSDFFDAGHEPKVSVGNCNYNAFPDICPTITNIVAVNTNLTGKPSKLNINDTTYCFYQVSDAAMGHTYNYYYYTTVKNQKCLVVNFDTSMTNCDFYLPLEQGNTEQANNYNDCVTKNQNQPATLNQVINTFKFAN